MAKNALVTGGSRGIGRAICLKLTEMGYHILINYCSGVDEAQLTLAMIQQHGGSGELMKFNVASQQEVEKALDDWMQTHPDEYIEVLVNNAGIRRDALLMWMKNEEWSDVISTNLGGFFYVTRLLIKNMLINKYGRIVNVVSLSGIKGLPGQTNYSAAKAGIIGATKALAQEVGKKRITVNAVAPGFIRTDMTKDLDEKMYKSIIPVERFGTPEEVAEVVGFLASEKASYITGEVISVNGGMYT
ncbi:MAG TPA: 3-oxoacyl-ACP reductase FabG [Bacteroidales bacterium]|nr:3-oxoacyl-ACP reductase FabG [Bacteroidales bacterium]